MLNKKSLAKVICLKTGILTFDAEEIVGIVFDTIKNQLVTGGEISISKFGIFRVKKMNSRDVRNPATGETMTIPDYNKIKFSPSISLKDSLNKK